MSRTFATAIFLMAGAALPAFTGASSDAPRDAEVMRMVSRVNAAEDERESAVGKVICTRRYTLRNKRWEKDAVMRVRISSDLGSGNKQYEILEMNAEGLQKKVFIKLLEAELDGSRQDYLDRDASITPANYSFAFVGSEMVNGKPHIVVQLKPKRNSKYLVAGKAWIDTEENAVVRVEGQTARSVSFWIGKPHIVQSFRKVENVWVAEANRSVSDVRFLGPTELTVAFDDYRIMRGGRQIAHNSVRQGF